MEERKKKKINSNYGILVILLFAMVCTLTDWIIIERKVRVCECPKCESTSNEVISGNTDNTQVIEKQYSYEDMAGVYEMEYDGSITVTNPEIKAHISLSLFKNGTYIYMFVDGPGEGELLGNYVINGNTIILNNQFRRGHDGGFFYTDISSKSLKINSFDEIYSDSGLNDYSNEILLHRNNDKVADYERYTNIINKYKLKNDVSE